MFHLDNDRGGYPDITWCLEFHRRVHKPNSFLHASGLIDGIAVAAAASGPTRCGLRTAIRPAVGRTGGLGGGLTGLPDVGDDVVGIALPT
ncbi:hypothetical protein [Micromonospora sp. SL4-19]|uniref:hypothetical protein n=1 Tax=Micromonospora sp. SL4-19 TaxID=3399129 RepID=UPI003A4E4569